MDKMPYLTGIENSTLDFVSFWDSISGDTFKAWRDGRLSMVVNGNEGFYTHMEIERLPETDRNIFKSLIGKL